MYYTYLDTPIGSLLLAGTDSALHYLSFPAGHKAFGHKDSWERSDAPFAEASRQIMAYFDGRLRSFDLPLELSGTAFQNELWRALADIPFGHTTTYGALANQLGRPKASRAIGAANGDNPIPLILPCHRVIGANGTLTGFGGGLPTKEFLLRHEGALPGAVDQPDLFGEPTQSP